MADVRGYNWGVFGTMNTGKTYQTMKIARMLHETANKRIIIFDHTSNESYKEYKNIIPLDYLQYRLPDNEIFKVQSDDFDTFCEYCIHYVRNSIIILDDAGVFFKGNFEEMREKFIKTAKNNANDIFYQAHSFRECGPGLLDNLHMILLKEIAHKNIPDKLAWKERIEILHLEICKENNKRPRGELYSYRIYNIYEDYVFKEDKNGELIQYFGREYFKKYEKQSKYDI